MNLDTIQQDIASLPPDAQQIIEVLKKRYLQNQKSTRILRKFLGRLNRLHRS